MPDRMARILVVDDVGANRFAFARMLAGEPYEVDLVGDANEALEALMLRDYAVVLCDYRMPGIDGIELARIVRSDPEFEEIPFVFVTAETVDGASIYRAIGEVGAYDWLEKPVDPIVLRGKLRVFTTLFRQRQQLRRQIAERERVEKALRLANRRLLRNNEDLEQFAYVASHDLQEPLRTVAAFCQIVAQEESALTVEERHRYLGFAVQGTKRMQALLTDLRQFFRIQSKADETFPAMPLGPVVEECLEHLEAAIQEADAVVEVVGELPTIHAAPHHALLVFQNLIGNAVKYRSERPCRVRIVASEVDGHWVVAIEDNGIGVDPQHHERIFGIFRRLHNREDYGGTGMGLAITRRLVERMGGSIHVRSTLGEGSAFELHLPMGSRS